MEDKESKTKGKMNKNLIVMVIIAVIFATGGFIGGMKYQQSKTPNFAGRFNDQNRSNVRSQFQGRANVTPGAGQNGFSRPTTGKITSIDDKGIRVSLDDGSSKIILFGDNTNIGKSDQIKKEDLKEGDQVTVFGQANSDGSITAQAVQVGAMNFFGLGIIICKGNSSSCSTTDKTLALTTRTNSKEVGAN